MPLFEYKKKRRGPLAVSRQRPRTCRNRAELHRARRRDAVPRDAFATRHAHHRNCWHCIRLNKLEKLTQRNGVTGPSAC